MGAYFIESQFHEKAISYFERAAAVQSARFTLNPRAHLHRRPHQVKWRLMVASCHRRSGA